MTTYDAITSRIIASLEAGVIPWRKPWKASAAGSATYIATWLAVFRNDSKLAIYAAQRAQKAADLILQRNAAAAEAVAAEEVAA